MEHPFDLSSAVRSNIYSLKPYRCARDDYNSGILLDANENTHGPSLPMKSFKLYEKHHLNRYPDPHQLEVKELLCNFREIPSPTNFFLGVGSDECIDMIIRVFATPGLQKVLVTPPTYGMYSVCCQINNVEIVKVPLRLNFQLDTDKILDAVHKDPLINIVILCSPGNPTGTRLSHDDLRKILSDPNYRGVVVVDEAYIDFCDVCPDGSPASVASWVSQYPNLIVTQTLSKAFGLAGIRLGFTVSCPEIATVFNNTKAPYNISTPTSHLAIEALSEAGLVVMRTQVDQIKAERSRVKEEVLKLGLVSCVIGAQDANFLLVVIMGLDGRPDNEKAFEVYKRLAEQEGVVVRFRGSEKHCDGCLRITIGTREENTVLLEKLFVYLN